MSGGELTKLTRCLMIRICPGGWAPFNSPQGLRHLSRVSERPGQSRFNDLFREHMLNIGDLEEGSVFTRVYLASSAKVSQ